MSLIQVLKRPAYLLTALIVSSGVMIFNIALMAKLPGETENMCVIGAGLNAGNIVFAGSLSLLLGLFAAGLIALMARRNGERKLAAAGLSGAGLVMGPLTVFCTLCTIPAVTLFGVSLSLNVVSDYSLTFKLLSLTTVVTGLFLLNRQFARSCELCRVQ